MALDTEDVTVGNHTPGGGVQYYGYDTIAGSISDGLFAPLGGAPIIALNWISAGSLVTFEVTGTFTNAGWSTLAIGAATPLNRTDALFDNSDGVHTQWTWSGVSNPFGTTVGQHVSCVFASSSYTLSAVGGTFSLAGAAATLRWGNTLSATSGAFILTGQAVTLRFNPALSAGAGSFALTGQAVNLSFGYTMAAGTGSFVLMGQDVTFSGSASMAAGTGSFVLSGSAVNLVPGLFMAAESGSFILSLTEALLSRSLIMIADQTPSAWMVSVDENLGDWLAVPERFIA